MEDVHIRMMIRRDMVSVHAIENDSFEFPWNEEEFIRCLRQRDCVGMIAEVDGTLGKNGKPLDFKVVGYMIYKLHKTKIELATFAVHTDHRRIGVGSAMVEKLTSKLAYQRRNRIELAVRETNMRALLFFKSLGFQATNLVKGKYEDTAEDAIAMRYVNTDSATAKFGSTMQV